MSTKTQSQHTPGPWQHDKEHHRIVGLDTRMGCTVIENVCKIMVADGDRETEDANARLIAAAPELLAAVQHVLIASEDDGNMNDIDFNMLRAAIAKAEGRNE